MVISQKVDLKNRTFKENHRTKAINKNIYASILIKGGNIIISLLLVKITIGYTNPIEYGIWLTISSVTSWLSFFDIGMGNGLRNKLTQSISKDDLKLAKKYISSTYAALTVVSLLISLIYIAVNRFINWNVFLNIPTSSSRDIDTIVSIVIYSFCIQFIFQLINTILTSIHKPAIANLINTLGQLSVLLLIMLLSETVKGNLKLLVIILTSTPIFILIISSIIFYSTKYKNIRPSFKFVEWAYLKEVFELGGSFFLIQIGSIILFQTSTFIIAKVVGTKAVTEFSISYKLFAIVIMCFSILITPYWSAFTDAQSKEDFGWMRDSINKIRKVWILISIIIIPILISISDKIYNLWLGEIINIPKLLTISIAIYVICYTGLSLSCYFLNGVGIVRLQKRLYIGACLINIPLGVAFGKYIGTAGIVIANSFVLLIMVVVLWIQIEKILNKTAKGIWIE